MLSKGLLCLLGLFTLASWGALGALAVRSSPESLLARFLFFVLLFISVFFAASSLAYYLSLKRSAFEWQDGKFRTSILCGIPPAVAVTVAMWLQSLRAFGTVSGLILLGGVLLVELVMILNARKNRAVSDSQESGQ